MVCSNFISKENHIFIKAEDNPLGKVTIVEEEADGININFIGNLVDLAELMVIYEECGNFKAIIDCGELTRNNNINKKLEVLQANRCPLRCKCHRQD